MKDDKIKNLSVDELEQTSGGTFIVKSGPANGVSLGEKGAMRYTMNNQPAVNGLMHNQAGMANAIKLGQDNNQPSDAGITVVCGGNSGEMA